MHLFLYGMMTSVIIFLFMGAQEVVFVSHICEFDLCLHINVNMNEDGRWDSKNTRANKVRISSRKLNKDCLDKPTH